ncbi:MAG: Transcriptional regulator [Succiniclasticum sp.]
MFKPKFKFTHDEIRIIVLALVELKNQLIAEGRYTDAVDDLLIKFVD